MSVEPREEWRPIPTEPGYEASSLGQVRKPRKGGPGYQILKGSMSGNGYRYIQFWSNSRTKRQRTAHSLIAEAFHGPRPAGMEVCHNDGDRLNNAADNLRYGTPSENRHDSVRHGTHRMIRRAA